MKKLVLTLLVVALAIPAMAGSVAVTTDVSTKGEATITLTGDAGIVGMGIAIDADANIDSFTVESFFDIFLDVAYAAEKALAGSYVYGAEAGPDNLNGADPAGPGVVLLPAAAFSISVGGLGGATLPLAPAPLITTIVLKAAAGATVDIDLDALRGGIVDVDGAMTVTGLPVQVVIAPDSVICHGDGSGDGAINGSDVPGLIATFGLCDGQTGYKGVYDFSGDGCVNGSDIPGFIAVFGTLCP
jgi:hypothetical protein